MEDLRATFVLIRAAWMSEWQRDHHPVGLPNAFNRLERTLDDAERS